MFHLFKIVEMTEKNTVELGVEKEKKMSYSVCLFFVFCFVSFFFLFNYLLMKEFSSQQKGLDRI
jgi:hypothetical protein